MNNRISQLLDFLKDDETDSFSRYALALELMKEGNLQEATHHLERLLATDPEYLAAYYQYGKLLEQQGKTSEALSVFEAGIIFARKQKNSHTQSELQSAIDNLE